ncbi:hypothetical protein TNCT_86251, partial [Trichonephila clavata]
NVGSNLPFVTFALPTPADKIQLVLPFWTFGREVETTLDAMFQEPIEYTAPDFVARLVTCMKNCVSCSIRTLKLTRERPTSLHQDTCRAVPSRCFFTLLERRSRIFHYAIKVPRARQDDLTADILSDVEALLAANKDSVLTWL